MIRQTVFERLPARLVAADAVVVVVVGAGVVAVAAVDVLPESELMLAAVDRSLCPEWPARMMGAVPRAAPPRPALPCLPSRSALTAQPRESARAVPHGRGMARVWRMVLERQEAVLRIRRQERLPVNLHLHTSVAAWCKGLEIEGAGTRQVAKPAPEEWAMAEDARWKMVGKALAK